MKKTLKKYFVSHKDNNFHAHLLHTKRTVFYGLVFLLTKGILVAFVLFLPVGVFVLPDVLAEEQKQILLLTNQIRQDKKLALLAPANKLDTSAQYKADDMAAKNYFAHSNDNKSLANWLAEAGYAYQAAGENLAVGFSSAEDIVAAWQKSPTHYANLVDTDFKELGIGLAGGVYKDQPTVFVVQHFGTPLAVAKVKPVATPQPTAKKSSSVVVRTEPTAETVVADAGVLAAKIATNQEDTGPVIGPNESTPIDKYMQAKKVLSPITNIFSVSQNIYITASVFFAFVLLINIAIHIRRRQFHVIAQTGGLIALLFIFWRF